MWGIAVGRTKRGLAGELTSDGREEGKLADKGQHCLSQQGAGRADG